MGLFDRLKKPPYNPDAPVNVPAEPLVPGSPVTLGAAPQSSVLEPEMPERREQIPEEPATAVTIDTPGRRFVSIPEARYNLDDTNRLAQAMQLPREQRDSHWLNEFQNA